MTCCLLAAGEVSNKLAILLYFFRSCGRTDVKSERGFQHERAGVLKQTYSLEKQLCEERF